MNKKLTPLKAFKNLREQNDFLKERNIPKEYRYDDELDVIETTLEENRELRTRNYELLKESEHFYNERNKYKRALEMFKENLVVSYDESENDKSCLVLGFKYDKDKMAIIYHTFDKEKIDLLKEVLL